MVPFWVPQFRPRITIGTQRGTIILTIPHVICEAFAVPNADLKKDSSFRIICLCHRLDIAMQVLKKKVRQDLALKYDKTCAKVATSSCCCSVQPLLQRACSAE